MPVTLSTIKSGFWIAMADATGAKTDKETQLSPAPTRVEYPNATLGEIVETADGRVVVQTTNRDPRRRSWVWSNFSPSIELYERQYRWLQQLTARTRRNLGLSPYIYVFDGTTNLLNTYRSVQAAATRVSTSTSITVAVSALTNVSLSRLKHATIDGVTTNERRSILSAALTSVPEGETATTVTLVLDSPLSVASTNIVISWSEPAWWKARVVDTTRELRDDGGPPRYTNTRFTFVIDEEMSV